MQTILSVILAILQAIPLVNKWFTKPELEKEAEAKKQVDEEHDKNAVTKRPSDDFWKEHGGL